MTVLEVLALLNLIAQIPILADPHDRNRYAGCVVVIPPRLHKKCLTLQSQAFWVSLGSS